MAFRIHNTLFKKKLKNYFHYLPNYSLALNYQNPPHLQVSPVLLTQSLLARMRNNFTVIEVWDKKTSAQHDQVPAKHCTLSNANILERPAKS